MPAEPTILHADLDAFYASVEQLLDPRLVGKPVLVGGGIVVAASYEARRYGVRAPMPTRDAKALCPGAIVVEGHFDRYLEFSDGVMSILEDATPVVEQISVDEAFLDVSGTAHLLGSPSHIAREIRRRVRTEIGLPISIGVSSTKFLSKIASARAKPDGLVVVPFGGELEFLHPLPVQALWGVGKVTTAKLARLGITTIGDLAETGSPLLKPVLGRAASGTLTSLAANVDYRKVEGGRRAGSVGSQQALGRGLTDREEMDTVILGLADRVGRRLRAKSRRGFTITIRIRFQGPRSVTRSHTLSAPTASTAALHDLGRVLLRRALADNVEDRVTLVGLSVGNLTTSNHVQLELDLGEGDTSRPGNEAAIKRSDLETSLDEVRDKFGRELVRYGSGSGGMSDDFRRLAERA